MTLETDGPRLSVRPREDVDKEDVDKYVALQHSAAFTRLRSRSRRYLAAMTVLFLGAFLVTVALADRLADSLRLLLAVGLILLPALASAVHLRYAGRRLDPLAARIREEYESGRD